MNILRQNPGYTFFKLFNICFLFVFHNMLAQEQTYIPDDAFEQSLIDQNYDDVLDDYVLTENIKTITLLNVSNKGISDLTGIEDFTDLRQLLCHENSITELNINSNIKLTRILCFDNQLTSLNLRENTNLTELYCDKNQLEILDLTMNANLLKLKCDSNPIKELDLSQNKSLTHLYCNNMLLNHLELSNNPELTEIYCGNNELPMLDLSQNGDLTKVFCSNNQLEYLNLKNGNNANITYFKSTENADLECINVDDVNYSSSNWTEIDIWTSYSDNCTPFNKVFFGNSDLLETLLIDCGYDDVQDGYVLKENINTIKSLRLGWDGNASSIDGKICGIPGYEFNTKNLHHFSSLEELTIGGIADTRFDLSALTELRSLELTEPFYLNDLDLSKNLKLIYLYIGSATELETLDLSNNTELQTLILADDIPFSPLEYLDLSQNINLIELILTAPIAQLDLSYNTLLQTLILNQTSLSLLDLSYNKELTRLTVNAPNLTSINLNNGNNQALDDPDISSNTLTCFQVDNVAWSASNWINVPYDFSENCFTLLDDSDEDGISNNADTCPDTPNNESVDLNGCSESQKDDDMDTVMNNMDLCPGTLQGEIVNSDGCAASQALSVENQEFDKSLQVYPNPMTYSFTVEAGSLLIERMDIYTPLGQKVDQILSEFDQIQTNHLSRGTYIIKIHSEKGTAIRRIIKQ